MALCIQNVVPGHFSVLAGNAFRIENGAVTYSPKACTVVGNLYQALNVVTAIGSDAKTFGNIMNSSVTIDKIAAST